MGKRIWIGGDAERFARYHRAVAAAGGTPVGTGDPAACAALLLPGGGDMEPWRYGQGNTASRGLEPDRDRWELALLSRFTAAGKPVLGVCRGMQVVNVFFGGTLVQDIPGHGQIDGADRMHPVRAVGLFAEMLGGQTVVNSAHHQAVGRLGRGLLAEQWTEDGVTEALRHTALPVWGVQWHPERLAGETGIRLLRAFLALCAQTDREVP